MYTLTVDDRELIVNQMQGILKRLDPDGSQLGATTGADALRLATRPLYYVHIKFPVESTRRRGIFDNYFTTYLV